MTLESALDAPREEFESEHAGRLGYYVDAEGPGRPLVLVHSVNAASSAYEVKPLFEHYRTKRPVYAIDLPGFGGSARGDRVYTPALYAAAVNALLTERVAQPADVVALSLAAEFAAAAALQRPEGVASLVLVSPTGLGRRALPDSSAGRRIGRVLGAPVLSDALFALLTSRPSLRYFLGLHFDGKPPAEMVEYAHQTARQPGAKFAPFAFLSFGLFTRDALRTLYEPLEIPALVLYDEDPNISFERLPELVSGRPNWRAERIRPTRGLPHWEEPAQTTAAMDRFWHEVASGGAPTRP